MFCSIELPAGMSRRHFINHLAGDGMQNDEWAHSQKGWTVFEFLADFA